MKILKKVALALFVLVLISGTILFIVLRQWKTSAIPDYDKNVILNNLNADVNVYRDKHAIPHVYAKNELDLYRSTGYVMAQDRLWQMDLLRRVTQGRLSEILGKDQVNTDLLMRALRIQEKSEKILTQLDPGIIQALEAFASGVNSYIESSPLPPEFKILRYEPELWKPVHSINLIGYMSWDLSMGWGTEYFLHQLRNEISTDKINELIPDLKKHKTAIYPEFGNVSVSENETLLSATQNLKDLGIEIFNGSNNWAVSGEKSKTGQALLANDMHLGLFAPGIWYQMHQVAEGTLNTTGLAIPGQPFIIAGHNDSVAWGMTNVMVDDLDFYAEKINQDSTKYFYDGEWKDLKIKRELIYTSDGDSVEKELKFTHRGPIINQFKKEKETSLSIHWLGNEMSNEVRTVYLLNRAANWSDFRDAVKTFKSVSQNIVYADYKGNIGLQCSAGVPIREGSGIQIYPGDSSKYDWKGFVPFEELPYEYNPERGFVSSANNKTASDDYPYYISYWFATPSRIDRIREMLSEKSKLGVEDFEAMHADFRSKTAEKMTKYFLQYLHDDSDWSEMHKKALKKLKNWNYTLDSNSPAASIFEILYRKTMENMVKDDLSPKLFNAIKGQKMLLENLMINVVEDKQSLWIDNIKTDKKEEIGDIVSLSFKETIDDLKETLGEDIEEWHWGKLHTFTLNHPLGVVNILDKVFKLNKGPFEMPGSFHTVCPYSYSYLNLFHVNHGASHRHIYDVKDWNRSKTIIPTGTSGIPASPYYLDQTRLYVTNKYHKDPFTFDEVEKVSRYKMTFITE